MKQHDQDPAANRLQGSDRMQVRSPMQGAEALPRPGSSMRFWLICRLLLVMDDVETYPEFRVMNCRECSDLVRSYRAIGFAAWGECFRDR